MGAVLVFAGGIYRRIVKKYSEQTLLTVGIVLMIVGLAGLAIVAYATTGSADGGVRDTAMMERTKPLFYLATSVAVIGFAFVNPSVSALVSKRADPRGRGR